MPLSSRPRSEAEFSRARLSRTPECASGISRTKSVRSLGGPQGADTRNPISDRRQGSGSSPPAPHPRRAAQVHARERSSHDLGEFKVMRTAVRRPRPARRGVARLAARPEARGQSVLSVGRRLQYDVVNVTPCFFSAILRFGCVRRGSVWGELTRSLAREQWARCRELALHHDHELFNAPAGGVLRHLSCGIRTGVNPNPASRLRSLTAHPLPPSQDLSAALAGG